MTSQSNVANRRIETVTWIKNSDLQSWAGVFFIAAVWTRSASVVVHFWMVDQGRAVVFMVLS